MRSAVVALALAMVPSVYASAGSDVVGLLREFWVIFGPGGKLHPAYFLEHKGHLVVEALLAVVILYLFLQHRFKPKGHSEDPLTDKEINELCKEWKPEPLVPKLADDEKLPPPVVIEASDGKYVTLKGGQRVLNLASQNYLGLGTTKAQLEVARNTIEKYGVGSCGPRGFYGTIDVHLDLEDALARFMGTEQCIIYSFDIATPSSIVPAFANRRDVLLIDERVSFPLQQGANLSRSTVHWFKHNDLEDLERLLVKVEEEHRRLKKPLVRKFIVVEGVYANYGDVAPLDKLYALKEKYKYRLLVDETHAFGVLGKTGRGACEHLGLRADQVEVICGTMSTALGSVGGFCVGTHEVVDHQRLSGSGYCFSASLPPFLATAAHQALQSIADPQVGPALMAKVQRMAATMRREIRKIPGLALHGRPTGVDELSPVIHITLAKPPADSKAAAALVRRIAEVAQKKHNVMFSVPVYSNLDHQLPPPSLCAYCSAALTDAEVNTALAALRAAAKDVLKV